MQKKIIFCLLVIFPTLSAHAIEVKSNIERAVVYAYGATITRVAEVNLRVGTNTIRLTGLVSDLEVEDVRVELENPLVEIGQVRLMDRALRDAYANEVRQKEKAIEEVKAKIQQLTDSTEAAQLRLEFIKGISQGYAKEAWFESARGTADIESWTKALNLIQSGSDKANKLIRENALIKKALNKDLSKLKRELSSMHGTARSDSELEITLITTLPQTSKLRLHYNQDDAFWLPHYEARLDSDSGELRLSQQAVVSQETDESWENIELLLSTSEPSGELSAPEVLSEFLSLIKPYKRRSGSMIEEVVIEANYSSSRMDDLASVSAINSEKLADAGIENVEDWRASIGSFVVNYAIPGTVSVPNDGDEELTFDLAQFKFDVDLVTQIVPREMSEAFLGARFVYENTLPMFGSDMTVFVDGIYVGKATMPDLLPQVEVVLPMGQDRRIEVKVQPQPSEDGSQGLVKKRKIEATDYIFEITNRRSAETEVEVTDHYPVANHDDIKVLVAKHATPPTESEINNKPGVVRWEKVLSGNETWEIRHAYSVSYPAKMILVKD